MRTIIDIEKNQLAILDDFSKKYHASRAAIIRKAIALFIQEHIRTTDKTAFGIWKNKKIDALAFQRSLRDEWND